MCSWPNLRRRSSLTLAPCNSSFLVVCGRCESSESLGRSRIAGCSGAADACLANRLHRSLANGRFVRMAPRACARYTFSNLSALYITFVLYASADRFGFQSSLRSPCAAVHHSGLHSLWSVVAAVHRHVYGSIGCYDAKRTQADCCLLLRPRLAWRLSFHTHISITPPGGQTCSISDRTPSRISTSASPFSP